MLPCKLLPQPSLRASAPHTTRLSRVCVCVCVCLHVRHTYINGTVCVTIARVRVRCWASVGSRIRESRVAGSVFVR